MKNIIKVNNQNKCNPLSHNLVLIIYLINLITIIEIKSLTIMNNFMVVILKLFLKNGLRIMNSMFLLLWWINNNKNFKILIKINIAIVVNKWVMSNIIIYLNHKNKIIM